MSSNPPTRVPTPPPDCSCDDHDLAPLAPPVEPPDPTAIVLAGGGAFTPGRYLKASGTSHTKLLVSICQAMGLTNTSFGDPATGSGPLAGL